MWLRLKGRSLDESALSPQTRETYRKLLEIYQPKENEDQRFSEPIEQVAHLLLTEDLLDGDLREELWG